MIACTTCGQENTDVARFCLACGTELSAAPAGQDERRIVSVVFVDLVGFTARAEKLDPEDVQAVLVPYHEHVRRELQSFGGTVEKFIGDAIMAVFGAPTAYGDDAERAVRGALAVRDSTLELDERELHLDLQLRIAVNTGEALVALGARPALGESMVAGDVVNTASRLQGAAPVNGVIVGAETYATTKDAIEYEAADAVQAKGKSDPVEAWVALRPRYAAGERQHSGELVGRARELEVLRGIWERVAGERVPHLVTVIGPAGIGKTRLTQEFDRTIEGLGGRSVHGRSLPYRESSAYFGFAMQVKQLCGIFDSDQPEMALAKLREHVADLPSGADAAEVTRHLAILLGLDSEGTVDDREELFFSVRCFIEAVARDRPTLLVFEDIHWSDRSLLDLIELLAARLRDLPIMLLSLARPELLDARSAWGGGLPAYTALPLPALSAEDSQKLAGLRLQSLSDEDAARLAETAEGNPLFIEQLAATLAESSTSSDALPSTVRGIVAARLDALPPSERSLLLDAAVIGKTFWRGALERIAGGTDGIPGLLGALEGRDLVVRETRSIIEGQQQYSFKHVLIREVAYELLPRARRRERHAAVARFFEDSTAELGEITTALARHWRDAGEPSRAVDYFIRAGEQAELGWAKDQAAILYREALDLVPESDAERLALLRRRVALARAAAVHIPDARQLMR
ncbi:MAG TPA: adenylate/guanylate cyclase domain-containing protein [Gaiellaceae bacterium]|nr:adenylate/guanylate cyclase domain-containing protein [Gaiellaceae bacterium]